LFWVKAPLSSFLFDTHRNDTGCYFIKYEFERVNLGFWKLLKPVYTFDIVMLSETEGFHKGVQLLENYCDDCRLTVNIKKKQH
jgi:hypothetical protein